MNRVTGTGGRCSALTGAAGSSVAANMHTGQWRTGAAMSSGRGRVGLTWGWQGDGLGYVVIVHDCLRSQLVQCDGMPLLMLQWLRNAQARASTG